MDRARTGSTIVAAILAVIVILLFGYFLWSDAPANRSELTVDPPIHIMEPDALPLEIIRSADDKSFDNGNMDEQDAAEFVENLAEDNSETVIVNEYADMFVRPDSIIALPELEERVTTLKSLMEDKSLTDDTPLTLRYTEVVRENTSLQQLEAEQEDHIAPITIVTEQGETITAPLVELLKREDIDHQAPVTQIREQSHIKQIKASELADINIPAEQEISVTISRGIRKFKIADLIKSNSEEMQDSLFYLHRVTEDDIQGLWGIIQTGLIRNFRHGIRMQRNGAEQNVSVVIPADADEPLPTGLSSFLGNVLNRKVANSYVYNFNTHSMGYDPNIIHPGQELILIRFSAEELKDIYQFFAEQRDNTAETFAISS